MFEQPDRGIDDFLSLCCSSILKSKKDLDKIIHLIEFHVGQSSLNDLPDFLLKHVKAKSSDNVSKSKWKAMKGTLSKWARGGSMTSFSLAYLLRKEVGEI